MSEPARLGESLTLSRRSTLRTSVYPDGIKLSKIDCGVNDAGNLEIGLYSQKGTSRVNILEIAAEDLPRFKAALTGWRLRSKGNGKK